MSHDVPFVLSQIQTPRVQEEWTALFPDWPCAALVMSAVQRRHIDYGPEFRASYNQFARQLNRLFSVDEVESALAEAVDRAYVTKRPAQQMPRSPSREFLLQVQWFWGLQMEPALQDLNSLGWNIDPIKNRYRADDSGSTEPDRKTPSVNDGYVYVLSNESLDCVKVGYTNRTPEERCEELTGQTGLPTPFEVEESLQCLNPEEVEQGAHKRLDGHRVSDSREFFDIRPGNAMAYIKEAARGTGNDMGGGA